MKQNLSVLHSDFARLKRREAAGHIQYSPIFIDGHHVAMAKFMAECTVLTTSQEMALDEKAEMAKVPLFYVRHDSNFTRFQVTPGNILAASFVPIPKTLSEDGLVALFEYCGR